MMNLFRGLRNVIFFSEIYYQLTQYLSVLIGLWLYLKRLANQRFISQVSLKKLISHFRRWLAFVIDLPIRLMEISIVMNKFALYYQKERSERWLFVSSLLICFLICLGLLISPAMAQTQNGFSQPVSGDVLSGVVIVQGTATDNSFLRYELAFLHQSGPNSDWIVFAQGDQPVVNGTLAVWDTSVGSASNRVFPDGRYQLRLRVVRQDFNYDEYFVIDLTIANDSGTPTATPTLTTTVTVAAATPDAVETTLPELTQSPPDVLPSLTPFPTPSPQATPVNEPLGPGSGNNGGEIEERQGVFEQISGIDTSQFGQAFWQGVRIVAFVFAALFAYLLLRGLFRRLWRLFSNKYLR